MLSRYDLYDLSAILKNIRANPTYDKNKEILFKTIRVLKAEDEQYQINGLRIALQSINKLDDENYSFVYTENVYVYFPNFLKHGKTLCFLTNCLKKLLKSSTKKDFNKVLELSDQLHNLPIFIAENNMELPKDL